MNTVLMYVIMCLVCRFNALGGGFRNVKFDPLYKYIYLIKKKPCREKIKNHERYDPVVCWETSELFTDLHFESRSLALFVCFDIVLCATVTHVPDSERMVGGRT